MRSPSHPPSSTSEENLESFFSLQCAGNLDEPIPTCQPTSEHTAWWSFHAPASGAVEIHTSEINPLRAILDLHISIFSGGCAALTEGECAKANLDSSHEILLLTDLNPGQTCLIRTGGDLDQNGSYSVGVHSPACFGYLNNDGLISTGDMLIVLGDFACVSACIADISGDGEVSTYGILALLGVVGTTCL